MKTKEITQKLTCGEIEIAVAKYFNPRIHLIVTGIRDGLFIHECDVLILNGKNYAVEVEIKVSKADVRKDLEKAHGHHSNKIRRLFFAIPDYLYTEDVIALIPERAGIFVVSPRKEVTGMYGNRFIMPPECKVKRNAKINKTARPFTDRERVEMGRLGMLRYWNIRSSMMDKELNNCSQLEDPAQTKVAMTSGERPAF